jgi:hypothetical protein
MPLYALTIFTGAFLLFHVQPLIGKYILPWFGGGPGVWTTCMLFFQVALLGGYAYAHGAARWLKPRGQVILHLCLLAVALALLPITPAETWKPRGDGNPTLQIVALLSVTLGLPYLVLSATGPLLQHWFTRAHPGVSPYRLYALSNAGSLLALVSYPFFFEPNFTRKTQAGMWGWGLALFAAGCAGCALRMWKSKVQSPKSEVGSPSKPPIQQSINPTSALRPPRSAVGLWLLLPACAVVLLLATTNKLCQDVAVIPFLWVAPMALYLLSFIVAFDSPRWYGRFPAALALAAALGGATWAVCRGADWTLWKQVAMYCGALFVCCLVCHGEVYRLRPEPERLTGFYLTLAAGGALGGVFVALVAPVLFQDYYELHWGLVMCGALFAFVFVRRGHAESGAPAGTRFARLRRDCAPGGALYAPLGATVWLGVGLLAAVLWLQAWKGNREVVSASRNFYGVLKVCEYRKDNPQEHYFLLQHGRITHGLQFADPQRARWPTSYYSESSGVGLAFKTLPTGPRRIGVVGLGTGSLTVYSRPGDSVRIYEINPEVKRLASSRFTYLSGCPGPVEIAPGDARLSLEREAPQHFDLLALDAFSSDSIPVHLLTREAFESYARHLNTNGVLAVHISNHFLDLEPVVVNLARQAGYEVALIDAEEDPEEWWEYNSSWMLLSRNPALLDSPDIRAAASTPGRHAGRVPLWTDDFVSLFQILK